MYTAGSFLAALVRRLRFSFRHLLQRGKTGKQDAINLTNYLSDSSCAKGVEPCLEVFLERCWLVLGILHMHLRTCNVLALFAIIFKLLGTRNDTQITIHDNSFHPISLQSRIRSWNVSRSRISRRHCVMCIRILRNRYVYPFNLDEKFGITIRRK